MIRHAPGERKIISETYREHPPVASGLCARAVQCLPNFMTTTPCFGDLGSLNQAESFAWISRFLSVATKRTKFLCCNEKCLCATVSIFITRQF